jgi:hypothetical protein
MSPQRRGMFEAIFSKRHHEEILRGAAASCTSKMTSSKRQRYEPQRLNDFRGRASSRPLALTSAAAAWRPLQIAPRNTPKQHRLTRNSRNRFGPCQPKSRSGATCPRTRLISVRCHAQYGGPAFSQRRAQELRFQSRRCSIESQWPTLSPATKAQRHLPQSWPALRCLQGTFQSR